jgi:hypothetical protein
MPPDGISPLQEHILLSLWKLKAIGQNFIDEVTLRTALSTEPLQGNWENEVVSLQRQGFVQAAKRDEKNLVSITPLGLAILRKVEEDRLQGLK